MLEQFFGGLINLIVNLIVKPIEKGLRNFWGFVCRRYHALRFTIHSVTMERTFFVSGRKRRNNYLVNKHLSNPHFSEMGFNGDILVRDKRMPVICRNFRRKTFRSAFADWKVGKAQAFKKCNHQIELFKNAVLMLLSDDSDINHEAFRSEYDYNTLLCSILSYCVSETHEHPKYIIRLVRYKTAKNGYSKDIRITFFVSKQFLFKYWHRIEQAQQDVSIELDTYDIVLDDGRKSFDIYDIELEDRNNIILPTFYTEAAIIKQQLDDSNSKDANIRIDQFDLDLCKYSSENSEAYEEYRGLHMPSDDQ